MINNIHNPNCDGGQCTRPSGQVRKLPTGGGSNLILCRSCFVHEINYRRERNAELDKDVQFSLPSWDELEVYPAE
jgi:hypothetical protein